MGLTTTDTVAVSPSSTVPDCIEATVQTHGCSPLHSRDDDAGTGLDIKHYPSGGLACEDPNNATCNLLTAPTCVCSRAEIRSGRHLVDCGGEAAVYTEPAPRSFTQYSAMLESNTEFGGGGTNSDKLFAGPTVYEVEAACYPLRVQFTIEACAYHPAFVYSPDRGLDASYWIGYANWWANVNGQPVNLEDGTIGTNNSSVSDTCEVFGYGGHFGHRTTPYILEPGQTLSLNLEFRVKLEGPIANSYGLRLNGGRIRADITEVTSLAGRDMEVC